MRDTITAHSASLGRAAKDSRGGRGKSLEDVETHVSRPSLQRRFKMVSLVVYSQIGHLFGELGRPNRPLGEASCETPVGLHRIGVNDCRCVDDTVSRRVCRGSTTRSVLRFLTQTRFSVLLLKLLLYLLLL